MFVFVPSHRVDGLWQVPSAKRSDQPLSAAGRSAQWTAAWLLLLVLFVVPARGTDAVIEWLPHVHEDNVYSLALSSDGDLCVSASGDGHAVVWSLSAREKRVELNCAAPVYDAVFDVADRVVTVAGDGAVTWWVDNTIAHQEKVHQNAAYALAVSRNGERLATGGGDTDGGDTSIRCWDGAQRKLLTSFTGHQRPVYGLAIAAEGHWLASASGDRTIRIWFDDSRAPRVLTGHQSDVYRCQLSHDDRRLVTCSQDGTVRIWDVVSGATIATSSIGRDPVYAVAYSPTDRWIASVGDDGQLRIHDAQDATVVASEKVTHDSLYCALWLPDGKSLLVSGADGRIRKVAPRLPLD